MLIISNLSDIDNYNIKSSVCTIGSYDALHVGHSKILTQAKIKSKSFNLPLIVFTFKNLPSIFVDNKVVKRILPLKIRYKLFEKIGVDYLIEIDFNDYLRNIKPEDFIKNILHYKLKVKYLIVGYNFKFGYNKLGNVEFLNEFSLKYNYSLTVIEQVILDGISVSSTYIRNLLEQGLVIEAKKFLGYDPVISGKIIKGKQIGTKLGFPTINLKPDNEPVLNSGVYHTKTKIKNNLYKSITNIGSNPTFEKSSNSCLSKSLKPENNAGNTKIKEHGKTCLSKGLCYENDAGNTKIEEHGKTCLSKGLCYENNAGNIKIKEHGKTCLSKNLCPDDVVCNSLFLNNGINIETFIFDFNDDVYNQYAEIIFIKRIRDEKRFNSIEELKKQIQLDIES